MAGDVATPNYLGEEVVELSVRPKRAAYLVRTGSRPQFRTAVEHACSRWGGLQEPIVPVSRRGRVAPLWAQIVKLVSPDIVFDVAELDHASRERASQTMLCPVADIRQEASAGEWDTRTFSRSSFTKNCQHFSEVPRAHSRVRDTSKLG